MLQTPRERSARITQPAAPLLSRARARSVPRGPGAPVEGHPLHAAALRTSAARARGLSSGRANAAVSPLSLPRHSSPSRTPALAAPRPLPHRRARPRNGRCARRGGVRPDSRSPRPPHSPRHRRREGSLLPRPKDRVPFRLPSGLAATPEDAACSSPARGTALVYGTGPGRGSEVTRDKQPPPTAAEGTGVGLAGVGGQLAGHSTPPPARRSEVALCPGLCEVTKGWKERMKAALCITCTKHFPQEALLIPARKRNDEIFLRAYLRGWKDFRSYWLYQEKAIKAWRLE